MRSGRVGSYSPPPSLLTPTVVAAGHAALRAAALHQLLATAESASVTASRAAAPRAPMLPPKARAAMCNCAWYGFLRGGVRDVRRVRLFLCARPAARLEEAANAHVPPPHRPPPPRPPCAPHHYWWVHANGTCAPSALPVRPLGVFGVCARQSDHRSAPPAHWYEPAPPRPADAMSVIGQHGTRWQLPGCT